MGRDYHVDYWGTFLTNSMAVLLPRQRKETPGVALRHGREVEKSKSSQEQVNLGH